MVPVMIVGHCKIFPLASVCGKEQQQEEASLRRRLAVCGELVLVCHTGSSRKPDIEDEREA